MKLTVIFDGYCGMCTRTVRMLHRMDKRKVLSFRPCQSVALAGVSGVTPTLCLRAVWAVAEDGTTASGPDAVMLIISVLLNNRWPYRLGRIPGIRHALKFGYEWVADNRRKFPGETPWCEQHPEECNYRKPLERYFL